MIREPGSRSSRKPLTARLAAAFVLVAFLFAGVTLSAAADDTVDAAAETETSAEASSDQATTETQPEEPPPPEEPPLPAQEPPPPPPEDEPAPPPPAPEPEPSPEPPAGGGGSPDPAPSPGSSVGEGPQPDPAETTASDAAKRTRALALREPELGEGGAATIWLHRVLPDPTPPAARLARQFARILREEASRARVHWSLVLGVLRAQGRDGRLPASRAEVRRLAVRLARLGAARSSWTAVFRFAGDGELADRAVALARYNRAVGLRGLVEGLEASKGRLSARVLRDGRIDLYPDGRADVMLGRVDVRVVVLLRYLAVAHGQVTVSSLRTGHRLYARPGVISAHSYGFAADIAALGGLPIAGNQEPGGLTERAVRNVLLLPDELRPQQVITLLGLGGPSFPLSDHDDHIHVGY